MTLYLKYRPKNLDELDLLDVGESLKKIMAGTDIPPAFLFAGPKGTGKTSAARILAKIINCTGKNPPCDKCEECISITKGINLDVIEMDAASNRGIDDVRALRDAVKLTPVNSKKKIYIIDEAHMLTTEASNALLKTLEEPPAHVIFILATTNPEKLIDTIKSRVTFIAFRKATNEEVKNSLNRVVGGEKMKIESEVLENIAKSANGSFRDAVKLLEQVSMEGAEFLTKNNVSGMEEFMDLLYKKNPEKLLQAIQKYIEAGVPVESLLKEILSKVHETILEDVANRENLIVLAELLIEANKQMSDSPIEELPLEIAIIKYCQDKTKTEGREMKVDNEDEKVKDEGGELKSETQSSNFGNQVSLQASDLDSLTSLINDDIWKEILAKVKPVNASVEALLRSSRPISYDGKTLTLGVFYKFHKERLEDMRHRKILETIIGQVLNSPTRVICIIVDPPIKEVIKEAQKEPILTEGEDGDIIKKAEEIFSN
ncbi:MAG TPA: DNA polymerase III subunit gamma/tau [Patescibacteria group bacterium]|nr:DNA polymerase III subunit gamma/tau [Patescibacteria group bacterium]